MHVEHGGDTGRRHAHSRPCWAAWLAVVLGGWMAVAVPLVAGFSLATASSVAVAQDEFLEDEPAAEEEAPQGQNLLVFFFNALGPTFSVVFLLISFALVSLVVMGFLQLRQSAMMPAEMVEDFNAHLDAKEWQQAYELASEDGSYLGQVLAAGISSVSSGYTQAVEAMRDAAANESMRLEHQLSYVGLIGALAPMIGLLGTVWGMVKSFMEIAASTTSPKPAKLAEGISTALITTLIGLVIAIVAVAVFAFFKNRLQSLNAAVDDEAMKVMGRFSKRSSQATAPPATA